MISNNLVAAKCCKSKKDIYLNRKNENALNNEAPVPKTNSEYSVSNNVTLVLSKMKIQIPYKFMIAHLNVNAISNKSDSISFMIKINVVILLISETKLDVSFPAAQIKMLALRMSYLYDRDSSGGELFSYIVDDILTKLLKHDFLTNNKDFSIEINSEK